MYIRISFSSLWKEDIYNTYTLYMGTRLLFRKNIRKFAETDVNFCSYYRSYRYAGYRQFTYFTYAKLGRYVRRIIPACAVTKIRESYPEESGQNVNFDGDDEGADAFSEIVQAWEYS